MDAPSRPAGPNLVVARTAVTVAVVVAATGIGVVSAAPRAATGLIVAGLCLPSSLGVLLVWRASVYTWRRAATRARSFVVEDGHAFLLLPDRATIRASGFALMCTFPVGWLIVEARDAAFGVTDWVILGLAVIIVPTAVLHAVFLWRGVPRPLVEITSTGVTARGFFGMAHVAWEAFAPEYAIVPDRQLRLGLPVYTRLAVQRRGLRPYSVRLPGTREPSYDPFSVSAAWASNPWWAGQALALYYRRPHRRGEIGNRPEHDRLSRQLRIYEHEIDEALSRYR